MRQMSLARLASGCVAAICLASAVVPLDAQTQSSEGAARMWTPPRTPDGHPDLQGVFDYATATPLQRPAALKDKPFFASDEEAATFLRQALSNRARIDDAPPPGQVGGYNAFWYEFGETLAPDHRTSLIVDPLDGRLPPLTPAAQARADERREKLRRLAEGPEDRDASERCILGYNSGPPMIGVGYNQHVQIVQTRDYVMLHNEMVHETRVAPLDGRPRMPDLQTWKGESRARWDGDTLVVDTRGFNDLTWNQFNGWNWAADTNLHVVERFTLVGPNTIRYEFTVEDPTVWTKPWSGVAALRRTADLMFEYACHEGNYGMEGILRGARAEENRAQVSATKP